PTDAANGETIPSLAEGHRFAVGRSPRQPKLRGDRSGHQEIHEDAATLPVLARYGPAQASRGSRSLMKCPKCRPITEMLEHRIARRCILCGTTVFHGGHDIVQQRADKQLSCRSGEVRAEHETRSPREPKAKS